MMPTPDPARTPVRRRFAAAVPLALFAALLAPPALAQPPAAAGQDPVFEQMTDRARAMSEQDYTPRPPLPEALAQLPADATRSIPFKLENSLWKDLTGVPFRGRLFHRGRWFNTPVNIAEVVDGEVRPLPYDPANFDFGNAPGVEPATLPDDLGYAGLTVFWRAPGTPEFREKLAFLGASYFRAVGANHHWGSSARGLAVDTAIWGKDEEFPNFEEFWVVRPDRDDQTVTLYALLNSPAVTGAYRFVARPGNYTTVEVTSNLFFRHEVEKLGISPLTSMYLFGEEQPSRFGDWRPEVHDADGLMVVTGAGEHVWRPLDNPGWSRMSRLPFDNPRGFGLIQRDRDFRNYLDHNHEFHRRPSVWVETLEGFGDGWVELNEFHSGDEDFDNIAAFWVPAEHPPVNSGEPYRVSYRLWFCDDEPPLPSAGRFVQTYRGIPDAIYPTRRNDRAVRYVLEAKGGGLDTLAPQKPQAVVEVDNGKLLGEPVVTRNEQQGTWRVMMDAQPDGQGPMTVRAHLRHGEHALTETWLYRWDWGEQ